jgi:flotillin
VASSDLVNMGITVVSYTLKDIRDEEGYLKVGDFHPNFVKLF